jgi:hypothetical protein
VQQSGPICTGGVAFPADILLAGDLVTLNFLRHTNLRWVIETDVECVVVEKGNGEILGRPRIENLLGAVEERSGRRFAALPNIEVGAGIATQFSG